MADPPALHIPDGMLSPPVSLLCWLIALASLMLASRRIQGQLGERAVPLMGVMAACIFAAQMINFPVAGGTSGHFLGGVLAAVLLGPWAAILVMTVVIGLQALLFQDGGLLVMGANILNMGVLTALVGYGLLRLVSGRSHTVKLATVAVASWLAVVGAALATSLELWLSGTASLRVVVPAMLLVHAAIGLGEALITVAAASLAWRVRPDLLETSASAGRGWALGGLLAALAVVVLAPLASTQPDGLERVAEDLGLAGLARPAPYELLPDYVVPALGAGSWSTIAAGIIGVAAVLVATVAIARALQRRRAEAGSGGPPCAEG